MLQRKLRTALTLSIRDWLRFFQAWFLLLGIDLGLRLLPFHRLQSTLKAVVPASHSMPAGAEQLIQLTQAAVDRAIRNHLYPMTCLRRALALQRLLARQGIPSQLRFGVKRQPDGIAAHAWLEVQGQPVGEAQALEERYVPLAIQDNVL